MVEVIRLDTPDLGDRSYVVTDGEVAFVVDPQRDIDRVLDVLERRGLSVSHVVETHIHNDYVTGGLSLAETTGASYVVAAAEDVRFDRTGVEDGAELTAGSMTIRVIHTPGHTPTHLSYSVSQGGAPPTAVFTGGSLLYGSVGRPDLIGPEHTDELARAQFRSARKLSALPPETAVYPTHGFGSFCSSGDISGALASTIGTEMKGNIAFHGDDEDHFVSILLAGLVPHPRYYAHMGPANRAGPTPIDLSFAPSIGPEEIRRRIDVGEWVVDLRARTAYAAHHTTGTIGIEGGDGFLTYLGWLIPWGTPVTLLGETKDQIAEAQRALTRIGIDRPAAKAEGGVGIWGDNRESSYPVSNFAALAAQQARGDVQIIDVRRADEWVDGHIRGATNLPIHELPDRIDEVPDSQVWVHCQGGYRASVACSLLDRAGKEVVLIDDGFVNAPNTSLEIVSGT